MTPASPASTASTTTGATTSAFASELALALALADEASRMLRAEFHRPGGPRRMSASSAPIDTEVEELLRAQLAARFPHDAIVGEELPSTGRGAARTWYLDPHDGTRAFLRGERGSAVSIALVDGSELVLGVVAAPTAPDDRGDVIAWARGALLTRNGKVVERAPLPAKLTSMHVVALNHDATKDPAGSAQLTSPARFVARASISYRLALVAVGDVDAAVSLSGPTDYDVAAGHALLRAVGGELVDARGRPFTYGARGTGPTNVFGAHPDVAVALATRGPRRARGTRGAAPAWAERYPRVSSEHGFKVDDAGVLSRAQGALLGQLAGDALGQLVEFQARREVARRYPDGVRDLVDGGSWGTIAGQPTDDSEMALIMARSIVREGRYAADHAKAAYVDWLRSEPFDVGTTTRRGLTGRPDSESESNGSLMRISPLAVHLWRQEPELVAVTVASDAALTHPSEACIDATVVFAVAVATAVREGLAPRALYDRVAAWVRGRDDLHAGVREIFAHDDVAPVTDFSRHQGWVFLALRNAFHQLLHASTLEDGLVATASQGGDADTTSAIAGALLGAVHGRDAVPQRWRRLVLSCRSGLHEGARHPRPAPFWPDDALELAERLVALGPPTLAESSEPGVTSLAGRRQRAELLKIGRSHARGTLRELQRSVGELAVGHAGLTGLIAEWGTPEDGRPVEVTAAMIARSSHAALAAMGRALLALEEARRALAAEDGGDDSDELDDDDDDNGDDDGDDDDNGQRR
jgi:ADP-ribosylglycohydrolase/fructose-1,6-bisphosphatase/inositol monophosphatase family enzyme